MIVRRQSSASCEHSPTEIDKNFIKKERARRRTKLNADAGEQLNLEDILLSFNSPISQEQAWALCYQTAKSLLQSSDNQFYQLTELSQIIIDKNGDVWIGYDGDPKPQLASEQTALSSLGMLLFQALDFGVSQEEEKLLSPDLETLITLMTDAAEESVTAIEEKLQETDDEGIERDSGDGDNNEFMQEPKQNNKSTYTLQSIIKLCIRHMQSTNEYAESHFRAVMRAYVAEALELSQFLEKVAVEKVQSQKETCNADGSKQISNSLHHLDTLDFNDWTDIRIWRAIQARFWVQVIGELRRGVKLKKVEANLSSRSSMRNKNRGEEFELTPYEILMDDIRERRYRLRKTPLPNPNLRKDAHTVILDFIRSRPPLKKASDRKLPPLQKESTLRELLMESIKKPPKPLKPYSNRLHVPKVKKSPLNEDQTNPYVENKESEQKPPIRRPRKLIPVDIDLKLDAEDDDDDDYNDEYEVTRFEEEEEEDESADYYQLKAGKFSEKKLQSKGSKGQIHDDDHESANPWRTTGGLRLTRNEYHRFCDTQLESYDLATQCPSRRASVRKHVTKRNFAISSLIGKPSIPHSRPNSQQQVGLARSIQSPNMSLESSPGSSPQPRARLSRRAQTVVDNKDDSESSQDWSEEGSRLKKPSLGDMLLDERLSLTLEEIVHIRSVLTKAELESLPVEGRVKEDVEKRRVCFLCLKTRFGLLGPWGQRCKLCDRTVCVKCYSKMRIPTEHFSHVPVVLLSPGLLLSPTSDAIGSAPASPASRRKDSALRSGTPTLTPTTTPASMSTPTNNSETLLKFEKASDKRIFKPTGSPAALSTTKTFSTMGGPSTEQRLVAERLRGVAMVVCHDCRIMVVQIIKSSRTTRATIRNNVISRLTLNLSPAYV
ncbi:protein spire isoform X2 [Prorops nasuta]|uniref:protein spire isoform X2 n=1 Tax=Prorops nasuta TaxID=863751 RepID=UPI0034CF0302